MDVSSSMLSRIEIEAEWLKRNRRIYSPVAREFDFARSEIEASLRSLDRRVRFNLYFFRKGARASRTSLRHASFNSMTFSTDSRGPAGGVRTASCSVNQG